MHELEVDESIKTAPSSLDDTPSIVPPASGYKPTILVIACYWALKLLKKVFDIYSRMLTCLNALKWP